MDMAEVRRREVERARQPAAPERGRAGTRWPWLIVTIALFATKADALAHLFQHRGEVITVLAVGLAVGLLRIRLLTVAAFAAPLVAFASGPASTLVGVGIGFGTFVLLMALFFTVSTALHARQDRAARR